jgi:ATP-dependent helicase/nuclease subunit A
VRDLASSRVVEKLAQEEDLDAKALARVSEWVLNRYEKLKARRGGMDFSDLEKGADLALESEKVRQEYHRRFDLVMVDEFQDTNMLQARILARFVRPDRSNWLVVGDPKQSIYRFRDADVSVFEAISREMPKQISLTKNYRSVPGLLEFCNDVCEPLFQASGLPYEALVPMRSAGHAGDVSLDSSSGVQASVTALELLDPDDLATFLLAEHERGVPLDDYALLLRKIRGNEKWIRALSDRGIPLAIIVVNLGKFKFGIRKLMKFSKNSKIMKWIGEGYSTVEHTQTSQTFTWN